MDCKDIRALFSEYYDEYDLGEISLEDFEAHLDECDECAAELEKYFEIMNRVRGLPRIDPPPNFSKTLASYVLTNKDTIKSIEKPKIPFSIRTMPTVAVAATLIVAFILTMSFFDFNLMPGQFVPLDEHPIIGEYLAPIAPAIAEFGGDADLEVDLGIGDPVLARGVVADGESENIAVPFATALDVIPDWDYDYTSESPINFTLPLIIISVGLVAVLAAVIFILRLIRRKKD